MSDETSPQTRHAQADELIRALHRQTIATTALAAAVGVLALAVDRNTKALEEMLADDAEDEDHDEDCDDDDCDGSCLDDPPPKRRKRK